jgi:hypothetical protein
MRLPEQDSTEIISIYKFFNITLFVLIQLRKGELL